MHFLRPVRYCVPILFFFLCHSQVSGQSALIQKEQKRLPFIKDSTQLVNSLNRIGSLYHVKNIDSCFYYGMKAKSMAIRLNYGKGATDADVIIATTLYLKGLFKESLELYSKTVTDYRQQRDTVDMILSLMDMGEVYAVMKDSTRAKGLISQATHISSKVKQDSALSLVYVNYCNLNAKLSNDSIRYYLNKARTIASRFQDKMALIFIEEIQADKLLKKGRRQEALPLITQALSESRSTGMEYFEVNALGLYADYHAAQPDRVLSYYSRIYKIVEREGYVSLKIPVLKVILANTELSGNKDKIISIHQLLEKAMAEENDNIKRFIGDYIKYNAIQEDNYLLTITNKTNRTKIWLLISICVVSILLVIIIYRLYQVSRRNGLEQGRLNRQIQEKNNALQEADELKSKLVSILAHDFRTPLISTISIVSMMRNKEEFTEEELELFYGDIESDATQMLSLFDIVLQWIKQQLSGYQFKPEALVLHDLFNEAATPFQQSLEAKQLIFSNQIPESMTVTSDREMLQFINRNLLSNAIKFSPEGGSIVISITQDAAGFTVMVADDGPGMSSEVISKLFSISSHFGSSTVKGAGIALSMCQDFIEKLGGRIWAENKKSNGTMFCYTIISNTDV